MKFIINWDNKNPTLKEHLIAIALGVITALVIFVGYEVAKEIIL